MKFAALNSTIIGALSLLVTANAASVVRNLMTIEQFKDWLDNTDADLTFVGEPIGDLSNPSKRNALNTIVTYCSIRAQGVCGGTCVVYNGGATCLNAPGTNCLSATMNVAFCDHSGCSGSCNQFSTCGTRLDDNFCWTPGTASILVGSG